MPGMTLRRLALPGWALVLLGCAGAADEPATADGEVSARVEDVDVTPAGKPRRRFRFLTLDGRAVSEQSFSGRMTVVVLVATYDAGSQAQARFLETVVRRHAPRINALMLVMEPPQNAPLAQAFADSLGLSYDVALADAATIAGKGAFPGLHHVPSIVLLDREGREVWRHIGVVEAKELDREISARDPRAR